jgi:lysophospholipase L1-like esterase
VNRRQFLVSGASAAAAFAATSAYAARPPASKPASKPSSKPWDNVPDDAFWHDVRDWGVEGRGFDDTDAYFDRFPARAKGVVRPDVWNLSRHTSGMSVRFETDSPGIYARYELTRPERDMPHMAATGVSGLDIYGKLDDKRWQWFGVARPAAQQIVAALGTDIVRGRRAYIVNLPLYNGVKSLEIGVKKGAGFWPTPPRKDKPILFYGTSITQGACASRPGMSFVNILGRKLDRPILNFGFSGNGRLEIEVGRLIAELDTAIYVIDCIANATVEQIEQRTVPLVKLLRAARPNTPILLLDERRDGSEALLPGLFKTREEKTPPFKKAYDALVAEGVANVHFRTADDVLGTDGEATVDGSHPNDLGMMRYADALEPDLRKLLGS